MAISCDLRQYGRATSGEPAASTRECTSASRSHPDCRAIGVRLDTLNEAVNSSELKLTGNDFHKLAGKSVRYTIHINGPWCITFEFEGSDAFKVDFDQYH
ncbi:type II toxin-antitoxin system RelE/ParE family toxin [Bradyrhizobium daqingense]|uniref:type II toxin-antitoxin system RelE/ParE family toxin n=1 Tax=Bradyrhizobium TaxID=374 RepID=UPI001E2E5379|nr:MULTISPECIES: type II toxin-antitoxin system RelE/ParE family toxin [Bradyrhizobium]UFS89182.1 type II toxin-antitoxin system RelE/ParE family toxin [Bradyrhizobium daqingense]